MRSTGSIASTERSWRGGLVKNGVGTEAAGDGDGEQCIRQPRPVRRSTEDPKEIQSKDQPTQKEGFDRLREGRRGRRGRRRGPAGRRRALGQAPPRRGLTGKR